MHGAGAEWIAIMKMTIKVEAGLHMMDDAHEIPGDGQRSGHTLVTGLIGDDVVHHGVNARETRKSRRLASLKQIRILLA
jgi:hypothetical protein